MIDVDPAGPVLDQPFSGDLAGYTASRILPTLPTKPLVTLYGYLGSMGT